MRHKNFKFLSAQRAFYVRSTLSRVFGLKNPNLTSGKQLPALQENDTTERPDFSGVVSLLSRISAEPDLWKGSLYAALVQAHHILASLFENVPDGIEELRRWEEASPASCFLTPCLISKQLKERRARNEDLVSLFYYSSKCSH